MKNWFTILCIVSTFFCSAQEIPVKTEEQLEQLGEINEESTEDDHLLQQLEQFRKNRLDLNRATKDELIELKILNELQADHIILYRKLLGKFLDIHELQAVPSLDVPTIRRILPFIMVGPAVSVKENFFNRFRGDHSILVRWTRVIEKQAGYKTISTNRFLGDPNQLMFRYRYQYKDLLYFGLLGEKDAGEQFFKGAQSIGFDFYSFHFFLRKLGIIHSLAIGDFTVNLGQGLVLWQGLGLGKSSEIMMIKRQGHTLQPYRSAGEFYFNRGVGIRLEKKRWESTFFFSNKKIGANLDDSIFTSFQTSGYYRTASELADRNALRYSLTGGNIAFRLPAFRISVNGVIHKFSIPLQKRPDPYNLYAVMGKNWSNGSIDFSGTIRNVHLFGEGATDHFGAGAFLIGALIAADSKFDVSILYRNLAKDYQALWATAFTESSSPSNEEGMYTGVVFRPSIAWSIAAYADMFRFPWLRFRVHGSSVGSDYLFRVQYNPDKKTEFYLRYRNDNKEVNGAFQRIPFPVKQRIQNLRLHLSKVMGHFTFRSRVEASWFSTEDERAEGMLGFIEGIWTGFNKWKFNFRLQYFETGSYEARIYAFEQDVQYGFSIPAFDGRGLRYYINISCKPISRLAIWLKLAQTRSREKTGLGSGLNLIEGRAKTEVRLQMQYIL